MLQPYVVYGNLKKQYTNEDILEIVKTMLKEKRSIQEIIHATKLDTYTLGFYIELAFIEEKDLDPLPYIDKEKFMQIFFSLYELPTLQSIKLIKDKNPNCSYLDIHIVRGVFLRTVKYPLNKTKNNLVIQPDKNAITSEFEKVLDLFKTETIKNFTRTILTDYAPHYFFSDHPLAIEVRNHTIKTLQIALHLINFDMPEVKKKNIVENYVYGNEFTNEEYDLIISAIILHDIFKYGLKEQLSNRQKKEDPLHPYYHRSVLKNLKHSIDAKLWISFLVLVENHKGKYSVKMPSFSLLTLSKHCNHQLVQLYHMLKIVQYSNYLAKIKF